MSRRKKPGVFFNCYMKADVHDALVQYAAETGLSKTSVVERAVAEYVMDKTNDVAEQAVLNFITMNYKQGQYVYAQAVARNTGLTRADVTSVLDGLPSLDKIREYRCPFCLHSNLETDIERDECGKFFCRNCDQEIDSQSVVSDVIYRVK